MAGVKNTSPAPVDTPARNWVHSIVGRWLFNSLGLALLLVMAVEVAGSISLKQWYYNGVERALRARCDVCASLVSAAGDSASNADLEKTARDFVENFEAKEHMELTVLNAEGYAVITSTGFDPSDSNIAAAVPLPDTDVTTSRVTALPNGEKVMIATRRIHVGTAIAYIRLTSSIERIDRQIFLLMGALWLVGILILLFVLMTGSYFVNSIVNPVREISQTAKRVAKGDFSARLTKHRDDELGELSETVNYMAQELAAAEKIKNDFISSVSHELRTPLTAIRGWAETIQNVDQVDRKTMVHGLQTIARETERLSGLVEDLLDFSRMQSGRLSVLKDKMDLIAELEEALYMYRARAEREQITLVCDFPDTLPPAFGDANRIKQVFVNIIDNGVKYSSPGGCVYVNAHQDADELVVSVRDEGCGIEPQDLPRVTEKFYRANKTRGGSGIGLAVADEIIRQHDGTLQLDSAVGVGTTVIIRLPVYHAETAETPDSPQ